MSEQTASTMPYRRLGRAGLKVSALSLGGWTTFGGTLTAEAEAREILHAAFDAGINFYDIADVYSRGEAELLMGRALADLPRRHLVISSKCFWPMSKAANDSGLSRKHIFESVHDSLKRIGTDYLDIFFCHRFDPETPLDETMRALDDLVHQGKILYWGTSEWTAAQIRSANELAAECRLYAPTVEQPQYNLLVRYPVENEIVPIAEQFGMGIVVWSPLASGLLSGKYDSGVPAGSRLDRLGWLRDQILTEAAVDQVRRAEAIAKDLGCTRSQLALAWALQQPGVSSVITGASSLAQLQENLGSLKVTLSPETLARLNKLFPARAKANP